MSNQWNAVPTSTASTEASGNGTASALPTTARTCGRRCRSSASIAGSGSTAVTATPAQTSPEVSAPVPAPRSSTSSTGRPAPARHHVIASGA